MPSLMENLFKALCSYFFCPNFLSVLHTKNFRLCSQKDPMPARLKNGKILQVFHEVPLEHWFSNQLMSESPEGLVRTHSWTPPPEFLTQQIWEGAWELAFFTSSQGIEMLALLRTTTLECSRMALPVPSLALFMVDSVDLLKDEHACSRTSSRTRRHLSWGYF